MNEQEFQDWLTQLIEQSFDQYERSAQSVDYVHTFEHGMVLTGNKGLIVRMSDGSEFQVTIVRSRWPENDGMNDDDDD